MRSKFQQKPRSFFKLSNMVKLVLAGLTLALAGMALWLWLKGGIDNQDENDPPLHTPATIGKPKPKPKPKPKDSTRRDSLILSEVYE